jgi:NDP-sugar pyrophosphorylase family protein
MYQIVIIAGGLGTRLGNLTKKIPKALIKIKNKPFIYYQLKQLSKQGFKRVLICDGYLGYKIRKYVGNGMKFNLNIQYSSEKKILLGTAGCIRKAFPLLEENFFITYGDTYLPINFKNIEESFKKKNGLALIVIYKNKNKLDHSNVCFKRKNIFYKKNSKLKKMSYIDYGVSVFKKEVFSDPKLKKFTHLSDIFHSLSRAAKLKHLTVKKRFYEIGSLHGLEETKNYLKNIN